MYLAFLTEFAQRHPDALMPAGLWAEALKRHEDAPPVDGELKVPAVAKLISRSEKEVRSLAAAGAFEGAYQEGEGGHWRIPASGVTAYLRGNRIEHSSATRRRHGPWKSGTAQ